MSRSDKKNNSISLSIMAGILAAFLFGSMFIQFRSVEKTQKAGIEGLREDELKTQIATYKSKYDETQTKINENQNMINEYKTNENQKETSDKLLDEELATSNKLVGLTDVTGEGIEITLTDNNYLPYTAENLRDLVNELKYAGAEAISINGNRVINLSDIVTVSGNFIVMYGGNVRISAPYTVKAIGDKKYLSSTLNIKNTGFVDLMKVNGLGVDIVEKDDIKIEKYNRDIEIKYMKEKEE